MNVALRAVSVAEMGIRVVALRDTAALLGVVLRSQWATGTVEGIADIIQDLAPEASVQSVAPPGPEDLVNVADLGDTGVLLVNLLGWDERAFRDLDRRRSELAREGPTVLLLDADGVASLMRAAPNFASWLGGQVFLLEDPDPSDAPYRAERLRALETAFGTSNQAVLDAAEAGTLPRDPEYAEWLVLLGRGDLLHEE